MKVYLQYPWKFPDSPYYKYLIDSPPKDIKFKNIKKQKGVITKKNIFLFSNFLKKNIRKWTNKLNLSIPNAHLSPKGDYDLIHCAHCLSKNKDKPWVADIEMMGSLVFTGYREYKNMNKVKKILMNKNCKKIMPWTKEIEKKFLKRFPQMKNKTEVIYPAIPYKKINKKTNKNRINLIFSGRYFFEKGGLDSLKAIDLLTKKYKNVYAFFNSEIPENILESYKKNKKISFYGLIPQEKLFSLYTSSDISIYPGYTDSFGFAYLESMSFGIPIVTVDGFARKEIVGEKKTGFVIPRPKNMEKRKINKEIVDEIISKTSILIENKKLREKMSKECIKTIKDGKFSIKERNKKLKKIYNEAIR